MPFGPEKQRWKPPLQSFIKQRNNCTKGEIITERQEKKQLRGWLVLSQNGGDSASKEPTDGAK
jgi:hypothetical protein